MLFTENPGSLFEDSFLLRRFSFGFACIGSQESPLTWTSFSLILESQPESEHASFCPSSCLWSKVCSLRCSAEVSMLSPCTEPLAYISYLFPTSDSHCFDFSSHLGAFPTFFTFCEPCTPFAVMFDGGYSCFEWKALLCNCPPVCLKRKPCGPSVCSLLL